MTFTALSLLAALGMVFAYTLGFLRGKRLARALSVYHAATVLKPSELQRAAQHNNDGVWIIPDLDAAKIHVCTACGEVMPCPVKRLLDASR